MQHTVHTHTLENGITLVLIPLSSTETVTSIVLMGVGSRYESDAQQGLAHFTEHMVFKGGKKFTTAQQIAQALDAVGGEFNAFTSQEFTGFYTKTAREQIGLGLDVLSDMVLHATFPPVELEKEKGVIVEEINMYEDMPMRKVDHNLNELVYGDTPMGRPILGTKASVTGFTDADFRHYREQFYKGAQCVIVIAGAVDEPEVTKMVTEHFKEMPKGEPYNAIPAVFATDRRVYLDTTKSEQSHLMIAAHAYGYHHPDRYAYRALATILGGNMSSRLFTSVREEQGLCYYVRAHPDYATDTGMLVASAGVDNNRLPQAISAIMKEIRSMREELVHPDELERSKQYILGKMLLGLEDSEEVAEFYGMQQLLEHTIESPDQIKEQVLAVTAEEILRVAKDIFQDERLRLAVVGPFTDAAALEALLTVSA